MFLSVWQISFLHDTFDGFASQFDEKDRERAVWSYESIPFGTHFTPESDLCVNMMVFDNVIKYASEKGRQHQGRELKASQKVVASQMALSSSGIYIRHPKGMLRLCVCLM